jgi:hypothetical protein
MIKESRMENFNEFLKALNLLGAVAGRAECPEGASVAQVAQACMLECDREDRRHQDAGKPHWEWVPARRPVVIESGDLVYTTGARTIMVTMSDKEGVHLHISRPYPGLYPGSEGYEIFRLPSQAREAAAALAALASSLEAKGIAFSKAIGGKYQGPSHRVRTLARMAIAYGEDSPSTVALSCGGRGG